MLRPYMKFKGSLKQCKPLASNSCIQILILKAISVSMLKQPNYIRTKFPQTFSMKPSLIYILFFFLFFSSFLSIIYFVYRSIMKGICFVILALLVVSATSRSASHSRRRGKIYISIIQSPFQTVIDHWKEWRYHH